MQGILLFKPQRKIDFSDTKIFERVSGFEKRECQSFDFQSTNMFEAAEKILSTMEKSGLTQEKIAKRMNCSQSYVANKLRLLKFSDEEKELILGACLTERHARALLRIRDKEARLEALNTVIKKKMNVAETEEYIDYLPAFALQEGGPL